MCSIRPGSQSRRGSHFGTVALAAAATGDSIGSVWVGRLSSQRLARLRPSRSIRVSRPSRQAEAAEGHTLGLSLSRLLPRANPSDLFVPFQRSLGRQTRIAAACPLATIEINACVTPVPTAKAAAGHTLDPSPLGGGSHGRIHRSLPRLPERPVCGCTPRPGQSLQTAIAATCHDALRPSGCRDQRACHARPDGPNRRGLALELSLSWLLPRAIPSARPIPKKIDLVQDRSEPELPAHQAAALQRLRRG